MRKPYVALTFDMSTTFELLSIVEPLRSCPRSPYYGSGVVRPADLHLTVHYGFSRTTLVKDLQRHINRNWVSGRPIQIEFGDVIYLPDVGFEHIAVSIHSRQLGDFNRLLAQFSGAEPSTYPEYTPHVTLATVVTGSRLPYSCSDAPSRKMGMVQPKAIWFVEPDLGRPVSDRAWSRSLLELP